jgi:hypothetical protein
MDLKLALGALVAGQLRRLFARREILARPSHPETEPGPAPTDARDLHASGL